MDSPEVISKKELERCTLVLEAIAGDCTLLSTLTEEERVRLMMAAGRVVHPDQALVRSRLRAQRRTKREAKRMRDRSVRASTSIRLARLDSIFIPAPKVLLTSSPAGSPTEETAATDSGDAAEELKNPTICYVCKDHYTRVHHFYDALCPKCADFNYDKRFQHESLPGCLKGRVALITGARLKIGYQSALMMLRAGAGKVIVTTRFPRDAALRFSREPDFAQWRANVEVHGLDLRHSPSVEAFARFVEETNTRLDILINNAAQTVRRPPGFYAHLLETEDRPYSELPPDVQAMLKAHEDFKSRLSERSNPVSDDGARWIGEWHNRGREPELRQTPLLNAPGVTASAALSQVPYACDPADSVGASELFPAGKLDADLQQVDLRKMNSWRMRLDDVPTAELLEVQLVNSIAPFVLCSKLKSLMMREQTGEKHVVNVSAMEGKFNRHTKTDKHPHTNMAKAALNMMTLTSARDYARFGIYMNAVDTGWVTDEDPAEISARKERDHDFQPPLDVLDGAARVMDPIFSGLQTGKHSWGNFLKDYVPTEW